MSLVKSPRRTEKKLAPNRRNQRLSHGPATPAGEAGAALVAPRDENALLMRRMEDSSLRQLWRLPNVLIKVRSEALTQKDVKNAGRSG
jgi:hypothetical protein